jgi:hypothetical protein
MPPSTEPKTNPEPEFRALLGFPFWLKAWQEPT